MLGRIIATLMGWMLLGPIGALLGFAAGFFFDKGLASLDTAPPRGKVDEAQQVFFRTTFLVLGHLAKADGRVSADEIARTEEFMSSLELNAEHRKEAIDLFRQGAAGDFSVDDTMIAFMSKCGRYPRQQQLLLEFVCHLAFADGELHVAEQQLLAEVARWLGIEGARFVKMLDMFGAQYGFSQAGGATSGGGIDAAYRALGIESSANDKEVKRAYRKLISQHHPDKLIAQGVPEDMVKMATEKSQEIRAAYETVCKARGM